MLIVRDLHSGYGSADVLRGVDIELEEGKIAAIIGPNGAGKTTFLMSICGCPRARAGSMTFDGEDITQLSTCEIARRGIMHVPEGRRVFPRMSVHENLQLGAFAVRAELFDSDLEFVLDLFPGLKGRLRQNGDSLSSGEQQKLALARALMGRPRLLLLDEPSYGLGPTMVQQMFGIIQTINRERGITVLLMEQNAFQALKLADEAYLMLNGRIARKGTGLDLMADRRIQSDYSEVGSGTITERIEAP